MVRGFGSPEATGRLVSRTAARGGPNAAISAKSSMGIRFWTARVGMFFGIGASLGLMASDAAELRRQRTGEIMV